MNKRAFTLVELIVVITILAILGTIAFVSFQGYSKKSRDSVRSTDLSNIMKTLELYQIKTGEYPIPDDGTVVYYETPSNEVWTQGKVGVETIQKLDKLDKIPRDPLTGNEYTYSRLNTKKEYEVAAAVEGGGFAINNSDLNIINQANAANTSVMGTAYVKGTYNGKIAKVKSGSTTYILAVPTIINGDMSLTDILQILNNKKLVYNGYGNLPASYSGTSFIMDGGFDYSQTGGIVVYSGSIDELKIDEDERIKLISNLQKYYDDTIISGDTNMKQLIDTDIDLVNPSDEAKLLAGSIIDNGLGTSIVKDVYGSLLANSSLGSDQLSPFIKNLGGSGNDEFNSVIFDGTNYVAVGTSTSDLGELVSYSENTGNWWKDFLISNTFASEGGGEDFIIAKFNTDGELIKMKSYGGSGDDSILKIIKNGNNYIAVGKTTSDLSGYSSKGGTTGKGLTDFVIIKFDNDLNIVNINNFGGTGNDNLSSLIYDGTNYVAVGSTSSDLNSYNAQGGTNLIGNNDRFIVKFNDDLSIQEMKNFGEVNGNNYFNDILLDGNSYVAVGGGEIIKIDSGLSNAPQVVSVPVTGGYGVYYSITKHNGNYIAVGAANIVEQWKFLITKYDSNLNIIKNIYTDSDIGLGINQMFFSDIIVDGNSYVAVGKAEETGRGEALIIKFDENLNITNAETFGDASLGNSSTSFNSVAMNGGKYLFVGRSDLDLRNFSTVGGNDSYGNDDFLISSMNLLTYGQTINDLLPPEDGGGSGGNCNLTEGDILALVNANIKAIDRSTRNASGDFLGDEFNKSELTPEQWCNDVLAIIVSQNSIPNEIYKLENLKALEASGYGIEEFPTEVYGLTNLTYLNLDFNDFEEIPGGISNLSSLEEMSFKEVPIRNISSEIGNINSLIKINLKDNFFLANIPSSFQNLTNLEYFDLRGSNFLGDLSDKFDVVNNKISKSKFPITIDSTGDKISILFNEEGEGEGELGGGEGEGELGCIGNANPEESGYNNNYTNFDLCTNINILNSLDNIPTSSNLTDNPGNRDVYKFILETGQTYNIETLGDDYDSDTAIYLYNNQGGDYLIMNDDIGGENDIYRSKITFTATYTGDYYLGVMGFGDGGTDSDYTLSITIQ